MTMTRLHIFLMLSLSLVFATSLRARIESPKQATQKEKAVTTPKRGTFEVKLTPVSGEGDSKESNIGRMTIHKEFHGILEGESVGQMLASYGSTKGSAGYVAMEKITGTLEGRAGTFVLQHLGTMDRGTQSQTIVVVPDSGTGDLKGLSGSMMIIIEEGQHFYEFSYSLQKEP